MKVKAEYSEKFRELLAYISATPELLSLLYDMDLMPEQLEFPSREGNIMIMLAKWHQLKFAEQTK